MASITAEDVIRSHGARSAPPKINGDRLWENIHSTAKWGAMSGSLGMSRLSLSQDDKECRDWFTNEAKAIGCDVDVDAMGNMFAVLAGQRSDIHPIGMGSHLDTQPSGGRFDGVLGVIGALEVLRTLKESNIEPFAPICAINWTNEEGARFDSGCSGSAVWSGLRSLSFGHSLVAKDSGNTLEIELSQIGYRGGNSCSYQTNPLSSHFELHIEQQIRLKAEHKSIGIVTGVQGIRWYKARVHGQQGHAGSVAVRDRADAFVATAKIILWLEKRALEESAFATVGTFDSKGMSPNTIPGTADITIDLRHYSEATLDRLEQNLLDFMNQLKADNSKFSFELARTWRSPAADFDAGAIAAIRGAVAEEKVSSMQMRSYAGHDSALTAIKVPTAMIFVPSEGGISHAPEEYTCKDDCARGVQILLQSVIRYDNELRQAYMVRAEQERTRVIRSEL